MTAILAFYTMLFTRIEELMKASFALFAHVTAVVQWVFWNFWNFWNFLQVLWRNVQLCALQQLFCDSVQSWLSFCCFLKRNSLVEPFIRVDYRQTQPICSIESAVYVQISVCPMVNSFSVRFFSIFAKLLVVVSVKQLQKGKFVRILLNKKMNTFSIFAMCPPKILGSKLGRNVSTGPILQQNVRDDYPVAFWNASKSSLRNSLLPL